MYGSFDPFFSGVEIGEQSPSISLDLVERDVIEWRARSAANRKEVSPQRFCFVKVGTQFTEE